jgi:nucleotide-binding universal stress UspA family protein
MNRPIVVGVDPVHEDPEPLALAALLAGLTGAPLVAVAAHPAHEVPSRIDTRAYNLRMREDAEAALGRMRDSLPDGARTLAVGGRSTGLALHDALVELDAALLVLGSAHRGALGRVVAGSMADRMLHGAGCPVAVVPRGYEAPDRLARIGAAFVDTPEAQAALTVGAALAARTGAALEIVTAVPPIDWSGIAPPPPADEAATLAAAERVAKEAVAELADAPEATVVAVAESPVQALAGRSSEWDLLVCGSRGYGPLRTVLLGSVSRSLSHKAECPLLVLPRDAKPVLDPVLAGATSVGA